MWGEVAPNVVCVVVRALPLSLYYSYDGFGVEYSSDPTHTVLPRSNGTDWKQLGPRGGKGSAAAPRVHPHPRWPSSLPPLSGGPLAGPRVLPHRFGAQVGQVSGPFF